MPYHQSIPGKQARGAVVNGSPGWLASQQQMVDVS
jgi:hypothetical protein